jgi:competence protein ComEC
MNHSFWHRVPVVRLLLPFSAGIGISMFCQLPFGLICAVFACSFLLSVYLYAREQKFTWRWVFGVAVSVCMFSFGIALHQYRNELRAPDHFAAATSVCAVIVSVQEQPVIRPASVKMRCRVIGVTDSSGKGHGASGSIMLYLRNTGAKNLCSYGDVMVVPFSAVKPVPPPRNPDEFDYQRYLAFNNIFFQAYAEPGAVIHTGVNDGNALREWAYSVQRYFKRVLFNCIGSRNETGVAEALLYGYDDDIDPETIRAYSNTGTLHVLAVSGMHVGIIFAILALVLRSMEQHARMKIVRGLIILAALWMYSLLCGLSPSILRATVMFSFIVVAGMLGVRSDIYNTLAASAFVLLCYDPNMLANVGFQLSYLAVIGIVFFQAYIYNWYTASGRLMDEVWKITAVSLAAQLVTFPIGLLYFHQFPNCFLFSNLIVIPLTTLILFMGMGLLLIGKLLFVSWLAGQLIYYTILFTNKIVQGVEQIPYAYVNGIHISIFQSILLYIIIGAVTAYALLKRAVYFKAALCAAVVLGVVQVNRLIENSAQSRLVVYDIRKHTAVHIIQGNDALLLADQALLNDENKMRFHMHQHIWKSGITRQEQIIADSSWKIIRMEQFTMAVTGADLPETADTVNVLLVTRPVDIDKVMQQLNPSNVVITSAVAPYHAGRMEALAAAAGIPVSYARKAGAVNIPLP